MKFIKYSDEFKSQLHYVGISNAYYKKYMNNGIKYGLLSLLGIMRNNLYILIDDDIVCGAIVLRKKISIRDFSKGWWIYGVFIKEDLRGSGLGRHLMIESLKLLKTQKIKNVFLKVELNNSIAVSLYKKIGFTEEYRDNTNIIMNKVL